MKRFLIGILLLIPSLSFGAEYCTMFEGKCKDVCAQNEEAVIGAFIDCTEKQECCALKKDDKKSGSSAVAPDRTKKDNKNSK